MLRRLFSILALLSLLLWFMLFAGWVRSKTGNDRVWFSFRSRLILLTSYRNSLRVVVVKNWPQAERPRWIRAPDVDDYAPSHEIAFEVGKGFKVIHEMTYPGISLGTYSNIIVFFWSRVPTNPMPNGGIRVRDPNALPTYPVLRLDVQWLPLLLVFAVLPVCWIGLMYGHRRRRIYRLRNHLCATCGYDLRASSDKCPECGTAIQKQSHEGTKEREGKHEEERIEKPIQ